MRETLGASLTRTRNYDGSRPRCASALIGDRREFPTRHVREPLHARNVLIITMAASRAALAANEAKVKAPRNK
jgi:hypothetical protein